MVLQILKISLIWHLQVEKLIGRKRSHCSVPRNNENAYHYDALFNSIETVWDFFFLALASFQNIKTPASIKNSQFMKVS